MKTLLTPAIIKEMNLTQHNFTEYRFTKGNLKDGETFFHSLGNGSFDLVEFVEFTSESCTLGRWNSLAEPGRGYSIPTRLAAQSLCIFGR